MNTPPPTKKTSAPLLLTSNAREQVKQHRLTKVAVIDVLKNRANAVKLGNGLVRFAGSERHPNIHITAGFRSKTRQWVITDIQIIDAVSAPPPKPPPNLKKLSPRQPVATPPTPPPPAIVFTNHARDVVKQENMDQRVVEQIIRQPDQKQYDDDEKVRFIGTAHGDRLHVIAKSLPKERKWLVITVELRYKRDPDAPPLADISNFDGEPTDKHPGIAFTTHALERMALRDISPDVVKQTIRYPEREIDDDEDKVKFIGQGWSKGRSPHVVAKLLPEENKWLVVSTWIRGEEDDGSLSTWQPPGKQRVTGQPHIVFTNKVRQWMRKQADVSGPDIEQAVLNPRARFGESGGKVKLIGPSLRNGKSIHAIAKFLPKENKWLVITAWVAFYKGKTYKPTPKRTASRSEVRDMWVTLAILLVVFGILAVIVYQFFRPVLGF